MFYRRFRYALPGSKRYSTGFQNLFQSQRMLRLRLFAQMLSFRLDKTLKQLARLFKNLNYHPKLWNSLSCIKCYEF